VYRIDGTTLDTNSPTITIASPTEEKDNLLASAKVHNEKLEETKKGAADNSTQRNATHGPL